jgi:hypothetical protein
VTTSRSRRDAVRRQRPSSLIKSARTVRTLSHSTGERAPSTSLTGAIGEQRHLTVLSIQSRSFERPRMAAAAPSTTCSSPPSQQDAGTYSANAANAKRAWRCAPRFR